MSPSDELAAQLAQVLRTAGPRDRRPPPVPVSDVARLQAAAEALRPLWAR